MKNFLRVATKTLHEVSCNSSNCRQLGITSPCRLVIWNYSAVSSLAIPAADYTPCNRNGAVWTITQLICSWANQNSTEQLPERLNTSREIARGRYSLCALYNFTPGSFTRLPPAPWGEFAMNSEVSLAARRFSSCFSSSFFPFA